MARIIKNDEFRIEVLEQKKPVIVDFFADWCGPCNMLSPIFEELENELKDNITFFKLNIDENIAIAQKCNVSIVPTMIIFQNGKIIKKIVGFLPKDQLKDKIEQSLK